MFNNYVKIRNHENPVKGDISLFKYKGAVKNGNF